MIYSNKVLYCLSFISLVVTVRYVSRLKVTMLSLLSRTHIMSRLYRLLGGTGNILLTKNCVGYAFYGATYKHKSIMGILLTKALAYVVVTLGLYSLITKEG